MEEADFAAMAQRLARPSVLLKRSSDAGPPAGVWGGGGIVPAPSGPFRHWLSVDCRFLPAGLGPSCGILSVYTNEEDCVSGYAGYDPTATLASAAGSMLYAHPANSLPPPDALSAEEDDAYIRLWQANCPLYTGGAAAVLGGWHFPWPDGDWEALRVQHLLVWTLEDSEPWVEVWGEPTGYRVMQRVT
jgi:hypothetical protein